VNLKKTIQWLIIFIFAFLIVHYFRKNQDELGLLFRIDAAHLIGIMALTVLTQVSVAFTHFVLLRHMSVKNLGFWEWFQIACVSRFINLHVTQGANIYRSIKLKKQNDVTYTQSIQQLSFLTWVYLLTTLIFAGILIGVVRPGLLVGSYPALFILLIATLIVAFLPFAINALLPLLKLNDTRLAWAKGKMDEVMVQLFRFVTNGRLLTVISLLCFAHFLVFLVLVKSAASALGMPMDLSAVAILTTILMISKYFNVVPGNIGITEYLCGIASAALGSSLGGGIMITALLRIADYLLLLVLALLFMKTFPVKEAITEKS